jgi:hypothetical protein
VPTCICSPEKVRTENSLELSENSQNSEALTQAEIPSNSEIEEHYYLPYHLAALSLPQFDSCTVPVPVPVLLLPVVLY